jgi:hypothetical protein
LFRIRAQQPLIAQQLDIRLRHLDLGALGLQEPKSTQAHGVVVQLSFNSSMMGISRAAPFKGK